MFLKELARMALTTLNFHYKGAQDDILILASPRSGSTWLMELLYTQPGMKYINEPLGKRRLHYHKLLPVETRWRYNSLTPLEESAFHTYFKNYRKTRIFGPVNVFDPNYKFVSNRVVFKVIRANALIEWFSQALDVQVVFLIRHPIAQSLSCIRRGHKNRVYEYLQDETFVMRYLDDELVNRIMGILRSGSPLEIFVTQWCLSNLVPLRTLHQHPEWLVVTYEELVVRPDRFADIFCEHLGLSAKEKLMNRIRKPSRVTNSSTSQTVNKIESGDALYLVSKWEREVSDEVEHKLFSIVNEFGISAYRPGRYFASEELLLFDPLSIEGLRIE